MSRGQRFQKKWNREPNRNSNFLDSPTRARNRNREIKVNGTGTGTVRTENFLLINEELFKCGIILSQKYQSTIVSRLNFARLLRLDRKVSKLTKCLIKTRIILL